MSASLELGNGNWAVKSDALLGYKTIDGKYYPREFTVTRATTATRVNEAGLVEVVPYNLLQRSEDFTAGAWFKVALTVTANNVIAPNGTLTADTFAFVDASSRALQVLSLGGGVYTLSVYAKIIEGVTGTCRLRGTIDGTLTTLLAFVPTSSWQRFEITFSAATSITDVNIRNSGGVGDFAFWGAQLVEGTEPLDYLPTTDRLDVARIDYSTGEPALLLEPQRTNIALNSEQIDNATWIKINATTNSNTTTSPSGILNADTLFDNTTNSIHGVFLQNVGGVGTYTYSFYAKANTLSRVALATNSSVNINLASQPLVFDLLNGVVVNSVSGITANIQSFENGWYRCSIVIPSSGSGNFYLFTVLSGTTANYVGSGQSLFLWGAQLEAGAYATSYIPTTTTSVTRNADSLIKTDISSLIGQTEGVMFLDLNIPNVPQNTTYLFLRDLSVNSFLGLRFWNGNLRFETAASGVIVTAIDYPMSAGGTFKIAMAYKLNDYAFYINGVQIGVDTSAIVPTCNMLDLFFTVSPANIVKINSAALFKTRLTNAELATLTTL